VELTFETAGASRTAVARVSELTVRRSASSYPKSQKVSPTTVAAQPDAAG
jgi:hypothetical protein